MNSLFSRMIYGVAGLLAGIGVYLYVRTTAIFEVFAKSLHARFHKGRR
ncbi:MAG: hypothetical protein M0Z45_08245 [Actinomycetota bacterium]|nr:hypothetical protein [Actinomycetota bacterium]